MVRIAFDTQGWALQMTGLTGTDVPNDEDYVFWVSRIAILTIGALCPLASLIIKVFSIFILLSFCCSFLFICFSLFI
jgi:hypothetical protein